MAFISRLVLLSRRERERENRRKRREWMGEWS